MSSDVNGLLPIIQGATSHVISPLPAWDYAHMSRPVELTPFQQNLARLREEKGFNNKSLAQAAGLNDTYVRDVLEKGKGAKRPSLDALQRLAAALGCTVADLTGEAADMAPQAESG